MVRARDSSGLPALVCTAGASDTAKSSDQEQRDIYSGGSLSSPYCLVTSPSLRPRDRDKEFAGTPTAKDLARAMRLR